MHDYPPLLYSILALAALALAGVHGASGAGNPQTSVGGASGNGARQRIVREASALVGTRELSGRNDGPVIDEILAAVGMRGSRAPYCAAFIRHVYDRAGLRNIGPQGGAAAWSPSWLPRPTWTRANGGTTPLPGDVFGIWFASKNRIAHVGLVERWGASVLTIEGNTAPDATSGSARDRDGDGIWRRRRLRTQIYSVRSWL